MKTLRQGDVQALLRMMKTNAAIQRRTGLGVGGSVGARCGGSARTGNANVSMPIEVVKSETGSSYPWSYIVILVFAALLCVVYVWRHAARHSARLAAPIA